MKKYFFIIFWVFSLTLSFAQPGEFIIKKGPEGIYLEHKTAAKEGLFPLGRIYNVHPRHLAAFNKLDFNKGLTIGQLIKIPLTDTNFHQQNAKGIPVYYKTTTRESLANISLKYNKVPLSNLRTWNQLTEDNIPAGTKLIIGFLVTADWPILSSVNEEKKIATPLSEKKEIISEERKIEAAKQTITEHDTASLLKNADLLQHKDDPGKSVETQQQSEGNPAAKEGGFFRFEFEQQIQVFPLTIERTLTASVFQANGVRQATQYYALLDGVEPGTVVRISNPANQKVIYAKVLQGMEGDRQNTGLDMRISEAAATALAIPDTKKFVVTVNY